jgi:hypothetical protein
LLTCWRATCWSLTHRSDFITYVFFIIPKFSFTCYRMARLSFFKIVMWFFQSRLDLRLVYVLSLNCYFLFWASIKIFMRNLIWILHFWNDEFLGGRNWERKQGEIWTWQKNWTYQGDYGFISLCPLLYLFPPILLIMLLCSGWPCSLLISCVPSQLWVYPPHYLWGWWPHWCLGYYAGTCFLAHIVHFQLHIN